MVTCYNMYNIYGVSQKSGLKDFPCYLFQYTMINKGSIIMIDRENKNVYHIIINDNSIANNHILLFKITFLIIFFCSK